MNFFLDLKLLIVVIIQMSSMFFGENSLFDKAMIHIITVFNKRNTIINIKRMISAYKSLLKTDEYNQSYIDILEYYTKLLTIYKNKKKI